jgi:hypothetical protein
MLNASAVEKINACLNELDVRFADVNERPWGSWDLLMRVKEVGHRIFQCRTFGWGYSLETAASTFFCDYVNGKLPPEQVRSLEIYLGPDRIRKITEVVKDCLVDEKLEELKEQVNSEDTN